MHLGAELAVLRLRFGFLSGEGFIHLNVVVSMWMADVDGYVDVKLGPRTGCYGIRHDILSRAIRQGSCYLDQVYVVSSFDSAS